MPCPLLALTGVPCPLCGATRAFVAAGQGDLAALLDANAVWVAYAVVALVAGLVGLVRRGRLPGPPPARALPALALPPWIWALANAGTIAA